jgi:hypothetical protein
MEENKTPLEQKVKECRRAEQELLRALRYKKFTPNEREILSERISKLRDEIDVMISIQHARL